MSELPTTPQYETPKPKRTQVIARNLAGRALGLGKDAAPKQVFEALAVQVGGFEVAEDRLVEGSETEYRHKDAERVAGRDAYGQLVSYDRDTRAFADRVGNTFLDSATARTANGDRRTGEKADTLRGRMAAKLVRHATKGVGVHSHLK